MRNFQDTFFMEHLWTTASINRTIRWRRSLNILFTDQTETELRFKLVILINKIEFQSKNFLWLLIIDKIAAQPPFTWSKSTKETPEQ